MTTRTYNPAGHLTSEVIQEPDGTVRFQRSYFYDEAGDLRRIIDGIGNVTEYQRDGLGRVLTETVSGPLGVASFRAWGYDAAGRLTRTQVGANGYTEYQYDGNVVRTLAKAMDGTVLAVTTDIYDLAGFLVETIDPNGNQITYLNDAAGHVLRQEVRDPSGTLVQLTVNEDDDNGWRTLTDDGTGRQRRYSYDGAGRVWKEE